ncbi:MAG: hypothetical protein RLZ95_977 [Bacteroidota bacterium]|jgi:hypothetical protein
MKQEEHQLQVAIVNYLRYNGYLVFSVPNAGARSKRMGGYYKAEGLLAGVSDLILVLPNEVIFIELKIGTEKQKPPQKEFEKRVKELGYQYWLIYCIEQLIVNINAFTNEN